MIYNEEEKKIYEAGFWAGRNSVKTKQNYNQEELEDIRLNLTLYLDALISDFAIAIDKIYRYPDWYRKIPILRNFIEAKEDLMEKWAEARNFLCYVQDKALPEYLDHINTKKDEK